MNANGISTGIPISVNYFSLRFHENELEELEVDVELQVRMLERLKEALR
jgi:hypothetical protein